MIYQKIAKMANYKKCIFESQSRKVTKEIQEGERFIEKNIVFATF